MKNTIKFNVSGLLALIVMIFFAASCGKKEEIKSVREQALHDGWKIISSEKVEQDGAALSGNPLPQADWVSAAVPTTVLGALVEAGIYSKPFFGRNLENIPKERFEKPWYFRKEFTIEGFDAKKEEMRIFFDGINYRANIWLNGTQIASQDTVFGAFRQFQFDITTLVQPANILVVEIIPPKVRDFYMGFVDWAPTPPDNYMGIYREVRLRRTGKAALDFPFVKTDVNLETLKDAELTISCELTNFADQEQTVTVKGTIENITFSKDIKLAPHEKKTIVFSPDEFNQLKISNPRLWWPNGLGNPEMYSLKLEVYNGENLIDDQAVNFGIRQVETYINDTGARGYKVNGRKVLIKSGGWVDDLFLRYQPEKDAAQVRYVKEMNMNSVRFEGFWGNSHHIYDLLDKNGILLMVGWSCQWEWPDYLGLNFEMTGDETMTIAEGAELNGVKLTIQEEELLSDYFVDQVKWLRNHPSIFCWAVGSDAMPHKSLEARYHETLKKYDNTRSLLISAGGFVSEISGTSGMKMLGPYEYVPPVYWFEDKKLGGAYGFNSEVGPGPQIPPAESIRKMMPEEDWWPPLNDMWNYHSGRKEFNSVKVYLKALNERYGEPKDLDELAFKAQMMNYEAIRPMFEAHVVNRYTATGVVQWMLNSPWPEFYWQLYDYYLMPTGAYFGTQKALQPATLIYDYYNHKIFASNDAMEGINNLMAEVKLYDIDSKVVFEHKEQISLKDDEVKELINLTELQGVNQVYFLDLNLRDSDGNLIADNFYWLSSKKDLLAWDKTVWFYTPQKQYADFKAINGMPKTDITAEKSILKKGDEWEVEVKLTNSSDKIAFLIELNAGKKSDGSSILPVFWSENYISLAPGESKRVNVKWYGKDLGEDEPVIRIQGANLNQKMEL